MKKRNEIFKATSFQGISYVVIEKQVVGPNVSFSFFRPVFIILPFIVCLQCIKDSYVQPLIHYDFRLAFLENLLKVLIDKEGMSGQICTQKF